MLQNVSKTLMPDIKRLLKIAFNKTCLITLTQFYVIMYITYFLDVLDQTVLIFILYLKLILQIYNLKVHTHVAIIINRVEYTCITLSLSLLKHTVIPLSMASPFAPMTQVQYTT